MDSHPSKVTHENALFRLAARWRLWHHKKEKFVKGGSLEIEARLTATTKNPFATDRVTEPFGYQWTDVADLNQRAFEAIAQEITFVRDSGHCRGVLVLGEAGSGKTHLLSRVHALLSEQTYLIFVPRPTNPESMFATIWAHMFSSLNRIPKGSTSTQGETLLREGFAHLIERSLQEDHSLAQTTKVIWQRFIKQLREGGSVQKVEAARNRIRESFRDYHSPRSSLEDSFVQALFNYLVYEDKARRRFLFEYLTKYEVDDQICSQIGLRPWIELSEDSNHNDVVKRREDWALAGCRVVSELASYGAPLTLAFDQLEGMRDRLELTRAWGDALREIMDQGRNLVVVCCVFPSLWREWFTKPSATGFSPLDESVIQRLASRKLHLDTLTQPLARELVVRRLQTVGIRNPRQPTFPLPAELVDAHCQETATRGVRAFLQLCSESFADLLFEQRMAPKPAHMSAHELIREQSSKFQPDESIVQEHEWAGRLHELLSYVYDLQLGEQRTLGKKVVPDHVVFRSEALTSGKDICVGICNQDGNALAARARNWLSVAEADPASVYYLVRSHTAKDVSSGKATRELLQKFGDRFRRLSKEEEQFPLALHATLVAIEEGDLWAGEQKVSRSDLSAYLSQDAVVKARQLFCTETSASNAITQKDIKLQDLIRPPASPALPKPPAPPLEFSVTSDETEEVLVSLRAFVAEHRVPIVLDKIDPATDVVASPHLISILAPMARGILPNSLDRYEKGLALMMRADARIYPDVARGRIVVEVARKQRRPWLFGHAFERMQPTATGKIDIPLGINSIGEFRSFDFFTPGPNLLVGGSAGSGKSNFLTCVGASIVLRYSPRQVKLSFCDVKQVDFDLFANLRSDHIHGFETEGEKIHALLRGYTDLMEARLLHLKKRGVKKWGEIAETSEGGPFHLIFIDEVADLFGGEFGDDCSAVVQRLVQKGRAAGIGVILCSQYPKASIIDSAITTNFTHRVAFRLSKSIQSKVILDEGGAEKLQGQGDCIARVGSQQAERLLVPEFSAATEIWFKSMVRAS